MNYLAIIIFMIIIGAGAKILVTSMNKKQAAKDEANLQAAAARDEEHGKLFLKVEQPDGRSSDSEYGTLQMNMGTRKIIPIFLILISWVALYCVIFNGDNPVSTNIITGVVVGILTIVCIVFMFQSVCFYEGGVQMNRILFKERFTYNDIINITKTNTRVNNSSSSYPTYNISLKSGKKVAFSGLVFSHVDWHVDQMKSGLISER